MKAVICTALAATGAILMAAPVQADQYDFISTLDDNGVVYADVLDAIDVGKETCRAMRSNMPIPTILDNLVAVKFAPYEAAIILNAASMSMCPDTGPRIEAFINSGGPAAYKS